MSDSVGQYLNEIGLVPLLTAIEERELSQIIEKGRDAREAIEEGHNTAENRRAARAAERAKDRFIRANLRLVVSVARRYPLPPSMELLDLIQEGNLGLEHAVDKFDWRKGFKFSTYATFWIRQAIGRASTRRPAWFAFPAIARPAFELPFARSLATATSSTTSMHASTASPPQPHSTAPSATTTPTSLLTSSPIQPGPESRSWPAEEAMVTGLLDVLDDRARYAVEQRFGLNDGRKRSYREVGEELGVPPRPLVVW